jgi:scyllo-inositol 2-dehydrogenase (NADP+)
MVSVGLVGFGYSGRTFHAPLISSTPGLSLDAIVQRHGAEASIAYPQAQIFHSAEAMLAAAKIQLAVIATSNSSHFPLAELCLRAGCHVVIDKPFTVTVNEARELVTTAAQLTRILSVFHNRRWDGDFLTLRQLIADNRLGDIVRFESAFDRFRPVVDGAAWRQRDEPGSGILFDLGPHLIDQALVAFGAPAFLTASVRRERKAAVTDDAFDLTFDYANGVRATLHASMLACAARPRFSTHGTRGSWVKHQLDPQEAALKRGERPPSPQWGQDADDAHGILTLCEGAAQSSEAIPTLPGNYLAYYENVRDAIVGRAQLAVTAQQSLHVMELLELSRQSHQEQRTLPVNLS